MCEKAWAALQRLLPVADCIRTSGQRHQADERLGSRQGIRRRLFDAKRTSVPQLLGFAAGATAFASCDRLRSTFSVEKLAGRSLGQSCRGTSTLGMLAIIDPGSIYEVDFGYEITAARSNRLFQRNRP